MSVIQKPGVEVKAANNNVNIQNADGLHVAEAKLAGMHDGKGKQVIHAKHKDGEESDDKLLDHDGDSVAQADSDIGDAMTASTEGGEGHLLLAQAETSATASDAAAAGGAGSSEAAAGSAGAAGGAAAGAGVSTGLIAGIAVGAVAIASGGASSVAAAAATGFTLAGTIALGRVTNSSDLVIEAFKADGTQLQTSSSTINADGTYTVVVSENYSGPVLLRLTDTNPATNNYTDEATGASQSIATDLRVMVNVSGNGTITAAITPLTELAVRQLVGDSGGSAGTAGTTLINAATGAAATSSDVTTTNNNVKTAFGLSGDITTTTPVTIDNTAGFGTASTAQQDYGRVLAAISGAETNSGQNTGQVLNSLAANLSGGNVLSQSGVDLLSSGATTVQATVAGNPGSYAAGVTVNSGTLATLTASNFSAIHISADTGGSATDFITSTAAQTVTATLDAALSGTTLWGSVDRGVTWTDISASVTGTALTWNGVTLNAGNSAIELAVTANTVTAFTGAVADLVPNTKIAVQGYALLTANPTFVSATAVNFAENGTLPAYATMAKDSSATSTTAGRPLTYTFGGTDIALFTTNASTGAITFTSAPNFENPLDSGANNVYDITVTATDGAGNQSTQAVAITVTNVNEAPAFTSATTANYAENGTAAAYTVAATDPENATLTYSLSGTDAAKFNIDAATGAVTFKASPNFEAPTDSGQNNVYDVTVSASDGTNTVSQAVAITVTNVNEAPTITSAATASFAENGTGTVYTATATDPDANTTLTYSLSGTDAALFNINASTGVVTFIAAPNFENPLDVGANNVYDVSVSASDGTNTVSQAVAISVTNVNEAPTLTSGATSTQIIAVNQPFSANASGLFADPDAGAVLTYSATGLPTGFSINSSTGVIGGTATATGTATIVVTAKDQGNLSVSHTITANVVSAPAISGITSSVAQAVTNDALTFTATISEAVTITGGTPTLTLNVGGQAMTATYAGGSGTNTLTFTATAPAGDSAAVAVTALNLNGATIIGNTTTQALVDPTGVTVSSFIVDNTAPAFTSATTASFAENGTGTAYASAVSDLTAVTYTLGGADAALFNINAGTGAVTFINAPNYEAPADSGGNNVYDITVTATDALGHVSAPQGVAITVTNVNEAPTLTSGATSTQAIPVNQVFSANASGLFADPDAGAVLTYSATGMPTGFSINSTTGVISGTPTTTGTATIVVTATDQGNLSVSHTITANVVTAPSLSSNIDNVTSFDVTSSIVLNASESVTAGTGFITITNDGVAGAAAYGSAGNSLQIDITDTTQVTISGATITIHPAVGLDLASNYHITVDAGALVSSATGIGSVAVSDPAAMNFSTVVPGAGTSGVAAAVASQSMDASGNLVAGHSWVDITGVGNPSGASGTTMNLSGGNIAMVFKDLDTTTPANATFDGITAPSFWVNATNFGSGDLLYVDNQNNALPNDLNVTTLLVDWPATGTMELSFNPDTNTGSLGGLVDITPVTPSATPWVNPSFTLADVPTYLNNLAYAPIVSA